MDMGKIAPCMFLEILVMGILSLAFNIQSVKASETICIKDDGSVYPSTAPIQRDGNLYTFTNNIYDEIVVWMNNIVIDGAGYTVQGTGGGDWCYIGIELLGRTNVTIKNMTIKGFTYGIKLDNSSYNNLIGNSVTDNTADGILLHESSNNRIVGSNIANNAKDGIFLRSFSNYNIIEGNNIAKNNIGILLCNSHNNTIIKNSIIENKRWGILLTENASNNIIYHNNFVSNLEQVGFDYNIRANRWDNGSSGNYWTDYTGQDSNGDGIGDKPYPIATSNQDNYPLMKPWNTTAQTDNPPLSWIIIVIIIIVSAVVIIVRKRRKNLLSQTMNP
ncbi:MAG: NosD domain-containing protein [Candidatus Bathyarchaeia archaeon]